MSANQTLVSYLSFKASLDLQARMIKLCLLLLRMSTNWSWFFWFFFWLLFIFPGIHWRLKDFLCRKCNLGLPLALKCSLMLSATYAIFQLWWRSTLDGLQLLVELSFWWSNSSHSFGFTQWWRFFSYYCCCAHLVRCGGALSIGIVQFTQLHSSIG